MVDMALAKAKTNIEVVPNNIQCVRNAFEPIKCYDIEQISNDHEGYSNEPVIIAQGNENGAPIEIDLFMETKSLGADTSLTAVDEFSIICELEIESANSMCLPPPTELQDPYNDDSDGLASMDNDISNSNQIDPHLCLDEIDIESVDVPIY